MDSIIDSNGDSRVLVTDLSLIKQLVTKLQANLGESPELCRHLVSQIFSLTERSIGIITSSDFDSGLMKRSVADAGLVASVPLKNTKKRKLSEKRKNQVRVSPGGGGETPVDDGQSWRKYGQKEILGAKYPRSYYRCTHRHSQGCQATKQVQRTDEDPDLFDVYYLGTHTCAAVYKTTATEPQPMADDAHSLLESLMSAGGLAVKTEGLAAKPHGRSAATTPVSMSSTPASVCLAPDRNPFSAPSASDNLGASPATSDSNPVASSFKPAEWWPYAEHGEVVSDIVLAGTPAAVPSMDITDDENANFDISSFFA